MVGVLRDKGAREMLQTLSPAVGTLYTVAPNSPRALSAGELAEEARHFYPHVTACETLGEALELAKLDVEDGAGGILVCGSLYLASQVCTLWQK